MLWGLFLYTFAWYLCRTAEIRKLQKKIRDYKPNQWTAKDTGEGFQRPSKVRLGVFGVQNSGKSSFLNSLHFALKGYWEEVYVERGNSALDGGETMFRDPVKLSDNVTTFDTRGLVDLSVSRVPEVIAQITGKRGLNTRSYAPGDKIDCPIFILKYRYTETQDRTEFLKTLVPEVRKHLCGYPIMVVTFANRISDREGTLRAITRAGMAKGSVFFIENYTDENHEMDSKKHIALLKILEACIKRADDNISLLSIGEENPNGPHY
eukprot:XP_011668736.1 PREDICTED: uncharacterized protein LOC105440383 [Strongylocentrotus purpuratus]